MCSATYWARRDGCCVCLGLSRSGCRGLRLGRMGRSRGDQVTGRSDFANEWTSLEDVGDPGCRRAGHGVRRWQESTRGTPGETGTGLCHGLAERLRGSAESRRPAVRRGGEEPPCATSARLSTAVRAVPRRDGRAGRGRLENYRVIAQSPAPGGRLGVGEPVVLMLSTPVFRGPIGSLTEPTHHPRYATIPDLVGEAYLEAMSGVPFKTGILVRVGQTGALPPQASACGLNGFVVASQTPSPGTRVPWGGINKGGVTLHWRPSRSASRAARRTGPAWSRADRGRAGRGRGSSASNSLPARSDLARRPRMREPPSRRLPAAGRPVSMG